jgi:uncharacterized protein
MDAPTIVIVPGLRDHVPEHWQTLLAAGLPNAHVVPPQGREDLRCARRLQAIAQTIATIAGEIILVAHSGGVVSLAHWARTARRPIRGALLAAPPDFDTPMPRGYPTIAQLERGGWLPVPRGRLPFPSIAALSRNDPLCPFDRAAQLAQGWGSRIVDLGNVGHLNPASGFGPWPKAQDLIAELS